MYFYVFKRKKKNQIANYYFEAIKAFKKNEMPKVLGETKKFAESYVDNLIKKTSLSKLTMLSQEKYISLV